MASIRSVFFDVGETIVDESREYGTWADWLGVPRHTFSAVFGAVIARGLDYRETFQVFPPGFDLAEQRERRAQVGQAESFGEENLYPDARPCLAALRAQGLRVGLAGNQTARAETILRSLDLPVDVIGTSDGWGVEKPSLAFFQRVVAEAGFPAGQVLYVGDRLGVDIAPAQAAGLATAWIRRGPWGHILDDAQVSVAVRSVHASQWQPGSPPFRPALLRARCHTTSPRWSSSKLDGVRKGEGGMGLSQAGHGRRGASTGGGRSGPHRGQHPRTSISRRSPGTGYLPLRTRPNGRSPPSGPPSVAPRTSSCSAPG